jgi:hypothetical protein
VALARWVSIVTITTLIGTALIGTRLIGMALADVEPGVASFEETDFVMASTRIPFAPGFIRRPISGRRR